MSNTIFRIFNPRGPKEDSAAKRRDQLRRAQRSYRDRKDAYIKSLETEIARTRASEATLIRESENLRSTIQSLTKLLSQHGIAISGQENPASSMGHSTPKVYTPPSRYDTRNHAVYGRHMVTEDEATFDIPTLGLSNGHNTVEIQSDLPPMQQDHTRKETPSIESQPKTQYTPITSYTNETRLCELDPEILGMDFVLTLESPCLGHLHGDPDQPDEPNGHALTTSAQLQFSSPSSHTKPHEPRAKSSHHPPEAVLSRLLDLAPSLCSDGEVTPIQAWNYVRCHPRFGGAAVRSLRHLEERLRSTVTCHGFGAVMEFSALVEAVQETLLLGQRYEMPFLGS
ncbi:hypothetical protein F4775DRAFT_560332 [Biscogniauxia sp. FL1348]|nr:hypothetical protein F4775DRAFT_560332 [Biscogniauxia sp. FL1348]